MLFHQTGAVVIWTCQQRPSTSGINNKAMRPCKDQIKKYMLDNKPLHIDKYTLEKNTEYKFSASVNKDGRRGRNSVLVRVIPEKPPQATFT